ncbi:MAG: NADH-quinone oxidoreductase subunit J [Anaerolineae bacterium]|nr:NADH-quinone oxidoreductase subunit J [Anaerolineae bacterium]
MDYLLLAIGSIICAVLAIRATRLLTAALWLAGVSVFTALILYLIGAREVAVIELSVGAGLVTVLFVFAISIAGEDAMQSRSLIPKPLAWLLIALALLLLGFLVLPAGKNLNATSETSFTTIFWQERALDVLAQIALIFAGVLGILGLLSEPKSYTLPLLTEEHLAPDIVPSDSDLNVEAQTLPEEEFV